MNNLMIRKIFPYLLILPALLLIGIFKLYPILTTFLEGFIVKSHLTFITYRNLIHDETFWNALWITLKINIIIIPFQISLSLMLAILVNNTIKGIGVFRTIYYLPVTISLTVATILWSMMFNPNSGIINSILGIFGISPQGFLTNKYQALWCIVAIASWKGIPYWMMFFLAGLKNIDRTIYESAWIDGASWVTAVIKITIPLLQRVLLFVLVANTTANVLLFVPMQMITKGGPEGSTNVLMYEAYKSAFLYVDRPRSAAMVTVLLFIIALACIVQFRLLDESDEIGKKRI